MKSRVCFPLVFSLFQKEQRPQVFFPSDKCFDFTVVKERRVHRPRTLLLGMSFFLILCWTIGAIWLIGVRRGERSTAEVVAQQRTIAVLFPAEMGNRREPGAGNFALFLAKPE